MWKLIERVLLMKKINREIRLYNKAYNKEKYDEADMHEYNVCKMMGVYKKLCI